MFWASVSQQRSRRSTECRKKLTAKLTARDPLKGPQGVVFSILHLGSRYNGTEAVLSSSPFASVMSATARPSFNEGVTLTARKPALARSAFCTAARSETFALAIAALWLCAAV